MIKKYLIPIVLIVLLCTCKTVNVKDGALLNQKKTEGFLFLTIIVDTANLSVNIFPRNGKYDHGFFARASAVIENLLIGENIILIKLPAGYYNFQNIYENITVYEMEESLFFIEPNTINYAGQLNVNKNINTKELKYFYKDDFENALAYINLEYPAVFSTYNITNSAIDMAYQKPAKQVTLRRQR